MCTPLTDVFLYTKHFIFCLWSVVLNNESLWFTVEWCTSLDVCTLLPDPASENVAAFSYQSKHTDRKYLQEGRC